MTIQLARAQDPGADPFQPGPQDESQEGPKDRAQDRSEHGPRDGPQDGRPEDRQGGQPHDRQGGRPDERQQPGTAREPGRELERETERLLLQLAGAEPGSAEAQRLREQLVEMNLPLVRQLARRYRSRSEPMEDILQAGAVGLVKAIDRYEPGRGAFLPFAIPTILGEIKRFFRDTSWSVRVPRRLRDRRLELFRTTDALTQHLGRAPTAAELAGRLGLTEEDIIEGLDACAAYTTSSLDAPALAGDDTVTLADQLGHSDDHLELVEQREGIEPALQELPARERDIVLMRFYGNMTQAQIGQKIGISQMHVSRLLNRSLQHLRHRLGATT